jgi:hypothetical protein
VLAWQHGTTPFQAWLRGRAVYFCYADRHVLCFLLRALQPQPACDSQEETCAQRDHHHDSVMCSIRWAT